MANISSIGLTIRECIRVILLFMCFCCSFVVHADVRTLVDPNEHSNFRIVDPNEHSKHDKMSGRIAEFDDLVKRRIVDIAKQRGMDSVIAEARNLLLSTKGSKKMAQYYIEVLEWIKLEGSEGINKERERLNNILTTDRNSVEQHYALQHRSILDSFLDSMAQQILMEMSGEVDLSNIPHGADLADVIAERKRNGILHDEG